MEVPCCGGIAFAADSLAGLIATQKEMGLTKQISEQVFDLMLAEKLDACLQRTGVAERADLRHGRLASRERALNRQRRDVA